MRKVIGVVGEGPTDYMVIKEIIDHITGEQNEYRRLQPEPDMAGRFGNGWKGVWRWCEATAGVLDRYFHDITPKMDLLVDDREKNHPLRCERIAEAQCPVTLPCGLHQQTPEGYEKHLENLIRVWLEDNRNNENILVTIPCDSTDAWIVAAYQDCNHVEDVENPWENMIARKKDYHGIRIPGNKKRVSVYSQLLPRLCEQWDAVVEQCYSARRFEEKVRKYFSS